MPHFSFPLIGIFENLSHQSAATILYSSTSLISCLNWINVSFATVTLDFSEHDFFSITVFFSSLTTTEGLTTTGGFSFSTILFVEQLDKRKIEGIKF